MQNISGDGTGNYLEMSGRLNTPASMEISSFTLVLSSSSIVPNATFLDIKYAGGYDLQDSTQAPWPVLSSITIRNNGVLSHSANSTAEVHKLDLTLSNMTIETGGKIDVSCKGYKVGYGPGAVNNWDTGAGYGGQGGVTSEANTPGPTYGSYSAPIDLGSGGANATYPGAFGGGAAILNVQGTLTLNGQILSNGCSSVGSGSGGSVYITGGALVGNGSISARGADTGYGTGGGGRVAVIASTSGFSGAITAFAGSNGVKSGGAGTVFIKTPGSNGTLIVDNNNIATNRYTGILAADNILDSVQALHKSSGTFLSFSTVTITGENAFFDGDNTSTVTVSGNVYGGSFPEVWVSSFSVKWGAAGNPSNAQFTAEISTYSDYSVVENSSATYNRNAFLTGVLAPNTTYYARVKTPDYATLKLLTTDYVVVGSTATLAAQPGTPVNPFTGVFFNSIDVAWLANGNPPYTEYRVMASTASDFSGTLYGPYAGPLSWNIMTSTSVISLTGCTLYYFRVQARNMNGIETGFEVLGSTDTAGYSASSLKFFDGTQNVTAARMDPACPGTTAKLKVRTNAGTDIISLVDVADPAASRLRIQTPEGVKAVRKYP